MTRSTPRTPSPEDRGVTSRRTIVAAGAWTVPVVAVAVATPAAAASLQPTLEFVGGPFTVAACGTLADVVVHATLDGTKPAVGQIVTVTLPAGLTFSDGTTTQPFTADLNGDVVLTGVKAFGGTTTGVITASAGTLVTTAPVSVTGGGYAMHLWSYTTQSSYDVGSLPAGVSVSQPGKAGSNTNGYPIGSSAGYFLGEDGNLYDILGRPMTTTGDVVSYAVSFNGSQDQVGFVRADGSIHLWSYTTQTHSAVGALPAGVAVTQPGQAGSNTNGYPIGSSAGYFLGSDGNLYDILGRPMTTTGDVLSYAVSFNGSQDQVGFVRSDGSTHLWSYTTQTHSAVGALPAGVSVSQQGQAGSNTNGYPIGSSAGYFLGSDGNLYDILGRPMTTTGDVVSYAVTFNGGQDQVQFIRADGSTHIWSYTTQASTAVGALPAGVSVSQPGQAGSNTNGYPHGSSGYFLGTDGNLYDILGRPMTTSGDVVSYGVSYNGTQDQVGYITAATC